MSALSQRRLDAVERFLLAEGETLPLCFLAARIAGPLDEATMRRALERLQDAYPMLAMTLVRRVGIPCFAAPATPPVLPLRFVERTGPEAWQELVRREFRATWPLDDMALFRVVVLRDPDAAGRNDAADDRISDIVVFSPHFVTDGHSVVTLTRLLLSLVFRPDQALRRYPPLPGLHRVVGDAERERVEASARKWALALRVLLPVLATVRRPPWRRGRPAPLAPNELVVATLDREATGLLRDACRRHGGQIMPALAVALLRAFRRLRGRNSTGKAMATVDIRGYLPAIGRDQLVPIAESVGVRITRPGDHPFWEEVARFRSEFDRRRARLEVDKKLLAVEELHDHVGHLVELIRDEPIRHDFVLGHVGTPAALPAPAPFRNEGFLGGSASLPWRNSTVVTSGMGGGRLRLTMVARPPVLSRAEMWRVIETALSELRTASHVNVALPPE